MQIIKTKDFDKAFKNLSIDIKQIYKGQEDHFINNYRDSRLHIKKIRSLKYAFSFRITRQYRAFFYFHTQDTAIFFNIGHRRDIYKKHE